MDPEPDEELRALTARAVRGEPSFVFHGWPHGITAVWEARVGDETRAYLKVHTQSRKYARERRAYREWIPRLPGPQARLLAEDGTRLALVLSAVAGEPGEEVQLAAEEERAIWRRAGEILAALHAVPFEDPDHPPLDEVLAGRLGIWLERAREQELLTAEERAWSKDRFEDGAAFRGLRPVPCHRDYGPRNWLVVREGGSLDLAVIDFEHANPDLWLMDIVKLWDEPWVERPDREEAFWEGYGLSLDDTERQRLRMAGLLHGVGTVVWSAEHGDEPYLRHGRAVLRRLRRELG